jgi:hypothetical protein
MKKLYRNFYQRKGPWGSPPLISFQKRLKVLKSGSEAKLKPKVGRFENNLPEVMEAHLISHVTEINSCFIPLSRKVLLKMTHET